MFVDPAPDPETSFLERERLFQTAGSSWSDYDPSRISPGGGVFDRRQKSVHTTPEIRAMLGLEAEYVTPNDLIWAILRAPADLLWLGGIGTFVKATDETHAEVGDRLNDALRVDASELRCRVVGEGANLGLTQRARVEVALAGVRLNTDAVDNSAGVDCSDHEVNIKILLRDIVAAGGMTGHQRNQILEEMTDEVAQLVLRDNYLQTLAISADAFRGAGLLDSHHRLILALERSGRLDRSLERLPSDQEIARRQAAGIGLTRPELAVLLAYSKIALYQDILASDLPDSPLFEGDLIRYFPAPIRHQHASWVVRHRLRRELVSTILTNALVNRAGSTFVSELAEKTGRSAADVARAFAIARDVFDLEDVWSEIEALETQIRPEVQIRMLECAIGLLQTVCQWFLRSSDCADIAARVAEYGPGVRTLASALPRLMPRGPHTPAAELVAELVESGVGAALARRVARLSELANACDIVQIAAASDAPVELVGRVFFAVGSRFGLNDLLIASRTVAAKTAWQKRALAALADDLGRVQRALAISVLANGRDADEPLEAWTAHHPEAVERVDAVLQDVRSAGGVDLAILTVAVRELQSLVLG